MFDLAKEIWQTMRTNKLRTFLTGFSVSWGIFMLILLLALAKGMVNSSEDMMKSNDPNRLTMYPEWTTMPYKGLTEGRPVTIRQSDFEAMKKSDPDKIESVTGIVYFNGEISSQRDYLSSSYCVGVYPQYFNGQFKLVHGRFINDADVKNARKVILLEKKGAAILFGSEEKAVGQNVKVGSITFKVIGVFEHPWSDYPAIPFTTSNALSGYKGVVDEANVHLKNVEDEERSKEVEGNVVQALSKKEKFDPADKGAVYVYNRFADSIEQNKANKILIYTMWVIGILTLLTGIVGVSNIMFVSVRERTHEIGIRRAIGAKPRNILSQVIIESVTLTTIFGYFGIVFGVVGAEFVKHILAGTDFEIVPVVDLNIAIDVTIALIIAGALAGIFPALRALKIRPVEALSEE